MNTNEVLNNDTTAKASVSNIEAVGQQRAAAGTTYGSASDLAQAMIRAAKAHGQHEARIGKADPNWPDWYAEYMVNEQSGAELPL